MEERLWWKIRFILRISGEIFFISIFKALFQSYDHSVPYDKNQRSFVKDMKCFCDVDKTPQILLNIYRTDKIKKGTRLTKSKLYWILMCKNLFMILIWYQSLAFSNMSFASQFLRKYVSFFLLMNKKHITFRSEALTRILKTCLFMAELSFAYFLMLITMTCNIWLFIAVVIGRGSGFYLVSPLISSYVGSEETDDCIGISINLLSTRHQQL